MTVESVATSSSTNPAPDLVILLGAGASLAVGMPSVADVTARVMSGEHVVRHTDGNYYFGDPNPNIPDGFTPRALVMVRYMASKMALFYFHDDMYQVTYEDIYYGLDQIEQSLSWEYENPLLSPFINALRVDMGPLYPGRERESRPRWRLTELVEEARRYVRDVIWHLLQPTPDDLSGLQVIGDACQHFAGAGLDIFTLNHDTTLEEHLRGRDMKLVDGFGDAVNGIRYRDIGRFESGKGKLRLFKLHGSVNWFTFTGSAALGIPESWDIWHTMDPAGRRQWPASGRPEFLCGTFNKILDYQSPIYSDLHYQFSQSLDAATLLLVVGYGFRDKAINSRLHRWMREGERRMVVVHPDQQSLITSARPLMQRCMFEWRRDGRLVFVDKHAQDCSWSETGAALGL